MIAPLLDSAAGHDDGKTQMNFVANLRVGQIGAAVDPAALTDDGLAAEMSVRPDHRVFADGHALFDVGGRRDPLR